MPTYDFEYQQREGADRIDPRPLAKRIAAVMQIPIRGSWQRDIELRIEMALLCAGCELMRPAYCVPFDQQYLYAMQRLSNAEDGRMICTPLEVERDLVLIAASRLVEAAVSAAELRVQKAETHNA